MIAIITGDIINSREGKAENWLPLLKEVLSYYGEEPLSWEVFRGDSFQLSVAVEKAILAVIHIKATIKQTKGQDVRMAIGVGDESYNSLKITESNGAAYVRSGECFESLKKQTLAIKSNNLQLDKSFNIMFSLATLTANNWSSTAAKTIKVAIENPHKNQKELAKILNKSQSSLSETLKRAGFDEIMKINIFHKKILNDKQ